jgi:rhodanese-related sulfurtransferase
MESVSSVEERARLIATAWMLLDLLKEVRSRQPSTADVQIMERWITRVAGLRENLDAITEWQAAEGYPVNGLHPGDALGRLFPTGLEGADFETELARLENELARDDREREPEPPAPPMTADDVLADLLTGHASARFRYIDVRNVDVWRRERLPGATNIPSERLADEAPRVFRKETDLVVFGDDDASTQAAIDELKTAGFERTLAIPRGFQWFVAQGWKIENGPG